MSAEQGERPPTIEVAEDIPDGAIPVLTSADGDRGDIDATTLGAAARALAHRLRPRRVPVLPADLEIEVVTADGVQSYHYRIERDHVRLDSLPTPHAVVRVVLQKPVDLVLMENGLSLMTVIASGRAELTGTLDDVLGIFGHAHYEPRPGRRSFGDLSGLLQSCRSARPREVARALDDFGRADFSRELAYFFVEAAMLSGVPAELPPATVRFVIGGFGHLCRIGPDGSQVEADGDGCEATVEIVKMETVIDRLLGRIGDMDAILSRRMLVAGPAVDDLMPLFERISTGLTVFTSAEEQREWTFPSASGQ